MPKSGEHRVNQIDSFFRVRPSAQNIREGEHISFIEDGKLIKQEKRNGIVYEQVYAEQNKATQKLAQTTGDVTNLIVQGSSTSSGDVTGITAGTGLTGGGSSGNITLNVVGGTGIDANADDIAIDSTVATLTGSQTLTNKSLTSPTFTGTAQGASLTLTGDLTVGGTTTTLNAQNLQVKDKNIVLNYLDGDASSTADGAGITIQDAVNSSTDATILWDNSSPTNSPGEFDFSHSINVTGNISVSGTVDGRDLATDGSKLDDIEALADKTDTANVTTAGALMDTEVTDLDGIKTLTVPNDTTISSFAKTYLDDADTTTFQNTIFGTTDVSLGGQQKPQVVTLDYKTDSLTQIQTGDKFILIDNNDNSDLKVAEFPTVVGTTGAINANEFARFTNSTTLEARSASEVLNDIGAQASNAFLDDIAGITGTGSGGILVGADHGKYITFDFSSAGFILSSSQPIVTSGTTQDGLLTYHSSSVASVESNLTFDGSNVLTATDGSESMAYTPSNNYLTIHETGATKGSHLRLATDNSDFILTAGGGTNQLSLYDVNGTANRLVVNSSGRFQFQQDISIPVAKRLYFGGGDHTYISEDIDDRLRFFVGGAEMFRLNEINDFASFFTDVALAATDKLYFDGGSDTFIKEVSADNLTIAVGGTNLLDLVEGTTDYVRVRDNTYLGAGSSLDVYMRHDGTNSFLENGTGDLYIRNLKDDKDIILQSDNGSGGVTPYITLDGSHTRTQANVDIQFLDDVKAEFGSGDDLLIFHNQTNSIISNKTGDLIIQENNADADLILKADNGSGSPTAYITLDGSAETVEIGKKMQFPASHSADKIVMYSGGNEKIGTEANTLLFTADNYKFKDTAGHDNLFMNNSGNVGIGTASPNMKLNISHGDNDGIRLNCTSTTGQAMIDFGDSGDNDAGSLRYDHNGNVMKFIANAAERMRIDGSTANVGIGTSSNTSMMVERLTAYNAANANVLGLIGVGDGADTNFANINFRNLFSSATGSSATIGCDTDNTTDTGQLVFSTSAGSMNPSERMRIDKSGNVGIGTNSPSFKLSVAGGDIQTDGYIRADDGVITHSSDNGSVITLTNNGTYTMLRTPQGVNAIFLGDNGDANHYYDNGGHRFRSAGGGTYFAQINSTGLAVGTGSAFASAKLHIKESGTGHGSGGIISETETQNGNAGIRFRTNGTDRWAITTIGTNGEKLRIRDSDAGADRINITSTGAFHVTNDVVAFSSTPSDRKLKTNVKDIEYGLDTIMKLKPKQYDWKKDDRHDIGFIAQEVEEVIPEIVKDNEWFDDKIKTMDYEKLTAVLIKAVQEQQQQINELKEKLNG